MLSNIITIWSPFPLHYLWLPVKAFPGVLALSSSSRHLDSTIKPRPTCEIIENIYIGLWPWFLAESSWNRCNFPSDKSTRNICSNIWSLTPVPHTEFLNPLEFSGSWMRTGCQEDAWNFWPKPQPQGTEEGLEIELTINHTYVMKSP